MPLLAPETAFLLQEMPFLLPEMAFLAMETAPDAPETPFPAFATQWFVLPVDKLPVALSADPENAGLRMRLQT